MASFDDSTARQLDIPSISEPSEQSASAKEDLVLEQTAPAVPKSSTRPAPVPTNDKDTMITDDFATALETFNAEPETVSGEEHIVKGTVLKITSSQVVVDIGAKSEGMLPLSEVLDHEGKPRFKPGDEID